MLTRSFRAASPRRWPGETLLTLFQSPFAGSCPINGAMRATGPRKVCKAPMRGHHDIWCGAEDQLISGGFRSPLATVRTWPIDNAQEAANQVTPSGADQLYQSG